MKPRVKILYPLRLTSGTYWIALVHGHGYYFNTDYEPSMSALWKAVERGIKAQSVTRY